VEQVVKASAGVPVPGVGACAGELRDMAAQGTV